MPYPRRSFGRFRRRRYGRRPMVPGAPIGRAPRWKRRQRVAQNLTRNVFWFKETGPIEVTPGGTIFQRYAPSQVTALESFQNYARSYEAYKVLKMVVKWYPASVGSEAVNPDLFHRGNVVTYIDQPPITAAPPTAINDVMSLPSARLCAPRRAMRRFVNRPRGGVTNVWPLIDHIIPSGNPAPQPDPWLTQVHIFGDNFGSGPFPGTPPIPPPPYYFVEIWWKVVFRSRYVQ